jgi:hypothetical protein
MESPASSPSPSPERAFEGRQGEGSRPQARLENLAETIEEDFEAEGPDISQSPRSALPKQRRPSIRGNSRERGSPAELGRPFDGEVAEGGLAGVCSDGRGNQSAGMWPWNSMSSFRMSTLMDKGNRAAQDREGNGVREDGGVRQFLQRIGG